MVKLVFSTIIIFFSFCYEAATIYVTNTNDSGAGSLREAIANANMGDIVRFDSALLNNGSDTILLSSEININTGLFINGLYNSSDTIFISGGGTNRIFNINMGSVTFPHIDLDSLVFINGNGTVGAYGGAIKMNSDVSINKLYIRYCMFRNNTAANGGAIGSYRYSTWSGSYQADIEIYNSTFKSNSTNDPNGSGGAIYIYRTSQNSTEPKIEFIISKSNFLNNTSDDEGGALFLYAHSYSSSFKASVIIDMDGSTFNGNETVNKGGAIYAYTQDSYGGLDSEVQITVNTSTIVNNRSVGNGGAIYIQSTNTAEIFTNFCTIANNTAFNDGSAFYVLSTESTNIYANTANISPKSCIFLGNAGNVNYNNTFFQSGNHEELTTFDYNIFDIDVTDIVDYNAFFGDNDIFNATAGQVNLSSLSINSFGTFNMIPNFGSIAVNLGTPWDLDDAQNGPILGIRDVGAAESSFCDPIPSSESQTICAGASYNFYGQTLTSAGNYTHTIVTANQCDTLITLTLSLQNPVATAVSIVSNPGNTIMTGTSVTFTATPTNGGTTPLYQWFVNGNPLGPNAPSVVTSGLSNTDAISCIMTSSNSCVTDNTAESNAITFLVHANNDEPCNAIDLSVHQTCQFSYFANHIATSTPNVGPHSCATPTSHDIWFKFVAPPSGNLDIYTLAGTLTDAVMSVYDGNCSSLFEAGCADDDGTNQMPQGFLTNAIPGTTYFIRVSGYNTSSGNFAICLVELNSNPTTNEDAASTDYATPVTINVLANDSDLGGSLVNSSLSIFTQSLGGIAVANSNGTITFNPASGFTGITTFVYEICDNGTPALCSTGTVTVNVGVNSLTEQIIQTSIFPNPTTHFINVQASTPWKNSTIMSLEGKILLNNGQNKQIDVKNLSTGVYFIELVFENGKISRQQFVKE